MLPKLGLSFLSKKASKAGLDPTNLVGGFFKAKAKLMLFGIIAGASFFFILIMIVLGVVSYFLGLVQENVDRFQNTFNQACILCSNEDLEKKKEAQFVSKIDIIAENSNGRIDKVVLASTVLFQGDYYEVMDAQYDADYDEDSFTDSVKKFFEGLSTTSSDGYNGIDQEEIDLVDAAAIIMYNSTVDGKYNEDSYKEALQNPGFGSNNFVVNGVACVAETVGSAIGSIKNLIFQPIDMIMDFFGFGDSDGNAADSVVKMFNSMDICQHGFIGGTFEDIKNMPEGAAKDRAKKEAADNIIEFAKFYRQLFPEEEDECVYTAGSVGTGDITNWRQCGAPWSNLSLGGVSNVCNIGCTATSMSYLIAKSGTQLTVTNFNPGVFVQNASFTGGNLYWNSWQGIAPNFVMVGQDIPVNVSNAAGVLSQAINTPCNGNHQPFIVLYLSLGHWVAFDHVENGNVYVMDPSAPNGQQGLVTLQNAWKGNSLYSYNLFCANDVAFGSTGNSSASPAGTAEANNSVSKFLKAMEAIADDNSHGYSISNRNGPNYDCSSFVFYSLVNAGILDASQGPFNTSNMGSVLTAAGFEQIPYDRNSLQAGDIVVDPRPGVSGHTTTIYSNENGEIKEIAAHYDMDGRSGDSSGNEISIASYSEGRHSYQYIYRLSGSNAADLCLPEDGASGEITIPAEYGNGGYTVTFYSNSDNSWQWAENSNQGNLYYNYWLPSGAKYDNGIATYDGRYLIACTTTYGQVGDKVDFYLSDGTKIPCIIADIKNPNDPGCNEWGHNNGQNVIEFEVARAYYNQYGNPGNNGWFSEWGGKRVTSATNLGSIW